MMKFNPLLPPPKPGVIVRYVVAVLSVTAALIIAQFLNIHWLPASGMLLLCVLMFMACSSVLPMARCVLAFKYYFATLFHSLAVEMKGLPRVLTISLALVSPGVVAQTAV